MVRFDEIARNVNDRVNPAETDLGVYVGLEHLDPESLKIRRWGTPDDVIGQKLGFQKGDVIFGKRRAYQRKLAVADRAGICSAHAMVLRAKADFIVPEFLPFFMQSDMFMDRAVDISVGSLSPTINWKTLRIQKFSLPPIDEQKRIACILRAVVETAESFLSVADDTWKMLRVLSNTFFPIDPLRFKVTPTQAELRAKESLRRLGDCCKLQSGFPFKSAEFATSGDRLLRCSNVGVNSFNWAEEDTRYWSTARRQEVAEYVLESGDIVIAMDRPFVGSGFKIARISDDDLPALLLQRVGRFQLSADLDADYLWAFIHSVSFKWQLQRVQQGTDLPHISRFDVEGTQLPVPSLDEQQEIADYFMAAERTRNQALSHVTRIIDMRNRLLHMWLSEPPGHVQ
ncbi:restriction endonuclease subunit S [Gimesia sp.]|uniref:restriction endonuclease subunit S n=1 Tax=Gimesia sp. TaxID=2024833 RepID=UPI0032EEBA21